MMPNETSVKMISVLVVIVLGGCLQPKMIETKDTRLKEERQRYVQEVLQSIRGQEQTRADSVFENIKIMKFVKAEDLVKRLMVPWSVSLGVDCSHCHVVNEWSNDAKVEKQIARQMVNLQTRIHNDLLDSLIVGFRNRKPRLNCYSCHRGQIKPEYVIPEE